MESKRKYVWRPSLEDIEWVMIAFDRRCDIQIVPMYAEVTIFGNPSRQMKTDEQCYITIMNEKDNLLFKLKYPQALLIEQVFECSNLAD